MKIAWALTGKYSKTVEEQQNAELATSYFDDILRRLRNGQNDAYADVLASSMVAASRTLSLIMRHRDYQFERIEDLKQNEVEMYKGLQSFSASFQSSAPRLSGIAIAGTTLPLLLSQVFAIPAAASNLLVFAFGGVGYVVSEVISSWIGGEGVNRTKQKYEEEKNSEYKEFLQRSRMALLELLDDVISSYRDFNASYQKNLEERQRMVDEIMSAALVTDRRQTARK